MISHDREDNFIDVISHDQKDNFIGDQPMVENAIYNVFIRVMTFLQPHVPVP